MIKSIILLVIVFIICQSYQVHAGTNIFLQPAPITILSTGDLMMGRSVNHRGLVKNNYGWSLKAISPFLSQFDYVVANLENPITYNCQPTIEGMKFCAHPLSAQALKEHQLDLLTLANNHVYDQGSEGLKETREILAQTQLSFITEGEIHQKTIENVKFGFLAYDDTVMPINEEDFIQTIKTASQKVDILFVALHYGQEYRYQPVQRQKDLSHLAIDSGADIVLGNHSHWLGPIELYQHGAIIYSHGNFIFDQMWSTETRQGALIGWTFFDGQLRYINIYPNYITDYGQANLYTDQSIGMEIIKKMQEISHLGQIKNGTLTINLNDI